jgi:predicted metal-dependent enzyme (double-stranded beta helix superfamily)
MNIADERHTRIDHAVDKIKEIASKAQPREAELMLILDVLKELAALPELWTEADFPSPEEGVQQARYLIREDDDRSYALYLNVMRRGKRTPIHNHTTWACIAAVEGAEHNYLYKRLDDGSKPGYAEVVEKGVTVVRPGSGLTLMPEDIHAVQIEQDDMIRHLHMYGRALETLSERVAFDVPNRTCRKMDIGVQSRRSA